MASEYREAVALPEVKVGDVLAVQQTWAWAGETYVLQIRVKRVTPQRAYLDRRFYINRQTGRLHPKRSGYAAYCVAREVTRG